MKNSLILTIFLFFVFACSKEKSSPEPENDPTVNATTLNATISVEMVSVGKTLGKAKITLSYGSSETITNYGVCWDTIQTPKVNLTTKTNHGSANGSGSDVQESDLTGLSETTTYYLRAYATNGLSTVYSTEISFNTASLEIGESYGGGKVAYIFQSGDPGYIAGETHGLIAANNDQSSGIQWGPFCEVITNVLFFSHLDNPNMIPSNYCNDETASFSGSDLGLGSYYTNEIVSAYGTGTNYAAKLCYDYSVSGYSDWHLPSIDEMKKLFINRNLIGNFVVGDFDNPVYYWTSRQQNGAVTQTSFVSCIDAESASPYPVFLGFSVNSNPGLQITPETIGGCWTTSGSNPEFGTLRRVRAVRYF